MSAEGMCGAHRLQVAKCQSQFLGGGSFALTQSPAHVRVLYGARLP